MIEISLIIPNLFIGIYLITFLIIGNPEKEGIYLYSSIPNITLLFLSIIPHFISINFQRYRVLYPFFFVLYIGMIGWNISYPFYLSEYKSDDLNDQIIILYLVALESSSILYIFNIYFLKKIKDKLIQDLI